MDSGRRSANDDRRLDAALRVDRQGPEARARGLREVAPRAPRHLADLKTGTDRDIRGLIAAVYRKIYSFAQLMRFYR